jgi:hypothetical protein
MKLPDDNHETSRGNLRKLLDAVQQVIGGKLTISETGQISIREAR